MKFMKKIAAMAAATAVAAVSLVSMGSMGASATDEPPYTAYLCISAGAAVTHSGKQATGKQSRLRLPETAFIPLLLRFRKIRALKPLNF